MFRHPSLASEGERDESGIPMLRRIGCAQKKLCVAKTALPSNEHHAAEMFRRYLVIFGRVRRWCVQIDEIAS